MKKLIRVIIILFMITPNQIAFSQSYDYILLKPDRVFDGYSFHQGWVVLVNGNIIMEAGPENTITVPENTRAIDLSGRTLMPGLIEGHAHILLHPYNETPWNDQVLKESESYRVARAVVHAQNTLFAGVTTLRDLGTEGAGYADVGIKNAIEDGVIYGPRMLIATRAIVATGSYGPKGFAPEWHIPLGAEVADGYDDLIKVVRDQIGKGADFIKVYADYRWGPNGEARPTFSREELELIVKTAENSGRYVVAHAATAEAMKRASLAGVETIEHGDGGNEEVYKLMIEHDVALCPTLAAVDAIMQYRGWDKTREEEPARIKMKKKSFQMALEAGVKICAGGDVGVYPHGDNVRELELMVEYGMKPLQVLQAATSGNAEIMHLDRKLGKIEPGLFADLIAVEGNPADNISNLRKVHFVMKGGEIVVDVDDSR